MAELFLGALAFVILLLLLQKLEHAETKLLLKTIKWTFVGVLVFAGLYLILVGRLLHVVAIAVLLTILLKQDVHTWIKEKRAPLPLSPPLTKAKAAKLLQVKTTATPEDIEKAFQKIKPKDSTHRDLLIQARDILLKKRGK